MYRVKYKDPARDDLKSLDAAVTRRVIEKIAFYCAQENPLRFAKRLTNSERGQYRFRVGDYRAIFDVENDEGVSIIKILRVKHRREIYGKS